MDPPHTHIHINYTPSPSLTSPHPHPFSTIVVEHYPQKVQLPWVSSNRFLNFVLLETRLSWRGLEESQEAMHTEVKSVLKSEDSKGARNTHTHVREKIHFLAFPSWHMLRHLTEIKKVEDLKQNYLPCVTSPDKRSLQIPSAECLGLSRSVGR